MNRIFALALSLGLSLAGPGFVGTATVANAACNGSNCD